MRKQSKIANQIGMMIAGLKVEELYQFPLKKRFGICLLLMSVERVGSKIGDPRLFRTELRSSYKAYLELKMINLPLIISNTS